MRSLKLDLAPLISLVVIGVIWQDLISILHIPIYVLPAPSDILSVLFTEISPDQGSVAAYLAKATYKTGFAALCGFFTAALLGISLGVILASVSVLRRGVYPLANLLQMVPIIAIAPLINIWLDYGVVSVAASAAIVSIFPVIANTVDGLRSVDPQLVELFKIYGANQQQRWRLLELPGALPQIFTGLKVAAGLAVIGAVVGELVSGVLSGDPPLGTIIAANLKTGKLDLVFAAIACSAIVGFGLFGAVSFIGRSLMGSWSAQHQREQVEEHQSESQVARERRGLILMWVAVIFLTGWAQVEQREVEQNQVGESHQIHDRDELAATTKSDEPLALRLQLNWVPEPEFGGIYEAKRLGFDREEGLDLEIIAGGVGTPTAQMIAQGKVALGVVESPEIISLRAKGASLIGLYASFKDNPRAILTREEGAPATLEELWRSERRLAVEPGSLFMRWITRRYGKSKLEWVTTQGGLAQIKQDAKLAQSVYVFSEPVSLQLDGFKTRVFPTSVSGFNPYAVIVSTSDEWLRAHPREARGLIRALRRGWESYLKDPVPTNKQLSALNPAMSLEAMNLAVRYANDYIRGAINSKGEVGPLGVMTADRWEELARQLQILGVIKPGEVDVRQYFWDPSR